MAKRLSDSEFAERTRAANRRRTERHHQRLIMAGKSALTVWLPATVRTALTTKAANDGATIADTAAALLSAALSPSIQASVTSPPVDSLPLFNVAKDSVQRGPADERLARILALKREQPHLSNYAIAAQIGCSEPTVRRVLKKQTQEAV